MMASHKTMQNKPNNKNRANQTSPRPLNICFSNVRGLRGNFVDVQTFLSLHSPDILALCETNLNDLIADREFDTQGYCTLVTKHDHLYRNMHGLGVYIKEGLPCARDTSLEVPEIPVMCFRLSLLHSTSYLFFIYRPQNDGCEVINHVADKIDNILTHQPSANICVFGDFNVHHIPWLVHSNHTDVVGIECFNFSVAYNLTQIVSSPTRIPDAPGQFPSLLDLYLTSDPDSSSASVLPPLGKSDHCVVSVSVDFPTKSSSETPFHRTIYRYSQADWDTFRSYLTDAPLDYFFRFRANKLATLLSEWILNGIDLFIPHRRFQQKPHSQPWFSPACAAAIAHRNHFFHLYHQDPNSHTKSQYRTASNRCKYVLNNAKNQYANMIKLRIEAESLGSREFWRITNRVLNRGKSSIPTIVNGPEIVSSSSDKASLFARNFASNSSLDDTEHELPEFPIRTDARLSTFKVTPKEVAKFISKLETSKAVGPDEIPAIVLKNLSPELSPILSKLFNRCIKESCFPGFWKTSSVCPVFKNSGQRSDPSKYRPISLLPIISKIFESIINSHISFHLEKHNLLSDNQYGFRSSRSTADVLTVITDRISRALDCSFEARAIALDISKAFDRVWHKGLLYKLESYGITGSMLSLVRSFLSCRKMKVVLDGQSSDLFSLNSGVPQGSVLGPTLFLVYINDLPDQILHSLVDIFADDTTLYSVSSKDLNFRSITSNLNADLSSISDWGKKWLVTFNETKTKTISFHHHKTLHRSPVLMNNIHLNESDSIDRLLGFKQRQI